MGRAAAIRLLKLCGASQLARSFTGPTRQIHLNLGVCVTYIKIAPEPNGFWLEKSVHGDIGRKVDY